MEFGMSLLTIKEKYLKYLENEKEEIKNRISNSGFNFSNFIGSSEKKIYSIIDEEFEKLKEYCETIVTNELNTLINEGTEGLDIKVSSNALLLKDEIINAIDDGYIIIEPFDVSRLKINYYELRLNKKIKSFIPFDVVNTNKGYYSLRKKPLKNMVVLDVKSVNPLYDIEIPDEGILLPPNVVFILHSLEYIKTDYYIPAFEKDDLLSSLGVQIQTTSTISSIGFSNFATFRMISAHPIIIYPDMTIGKVYFYNTGKKTIDF
jgi:dCTP deaminase